MIGAATRCRFAPALGQISTKQISFCGIVRSVTGLPGVKDIVNKIGCSPAMRSTLSSAIISNYTKQTGTTVTAAPWYTQMMAIAGPDIIADCVCEGQKPPPGAPPPAEKTMSPLVIGAIALAAVGVAVLAARRQSQPAQPSILMVPAPAAPAAVAPAPAAAVAPVAAPVAAKPKAAPAAPSPGAAQRRYRRY